MFSLTEKVVRTAKPKDKDFYIKDGGGLFLLVTPKGSKFWKFRYQFHGQARKLALGEYSAMSLDEARAKVATLKGQIAHYVDPATVSQKKDTFEKIAKEWLNKFAKTVTKKSFSLVKSRLNTYILPKFGNVAIQDVTCTCQEKLDTKG